MLSLIATTARGLEEVTAAELKELGADAVQVQPATVRFEGSLETLYKANMWLRSASRVLVSAASFTFTSPDEIYQLASEQPWEQWLTPAMTFSVQASARDAARHGINNSHFAALRIKDAIVDRQRSKTGRRSSVDTRNPGLTIRVRIVGNRCDLSLDSSGEALHQRGYRSRPRDPKAPTATVAPLRESLAGALVLISGWKGESALVDPFCGGATLLIEACSLALDRAPGLIRPRFAFLGWPDHDTGLWQRVRSEARDRARAAARSLPPILGTDIDAVGIGAARRALRTAGLEDHIQLQPVDARDARPPPDTSKGTVLCNPPYGERIASVQELEPLYGAFGDVLKQHFGGWTAWILCAAPELLSAVGLRTNRRRVVWNGAIECRFARYDLYSSRKAQP